MNDEGLEVLVMYVETASRLAESIALDVKNNNQISNETVLSLNAFIEAANNFGHVTKVLAAKRNQLN